jgi:hypothetical protein
MKLEKQPYPRLIWSILSTIPDIVVTGGVVMLGLWWIINRRVELAGAGNPRAEEETGDPMLREEHSPPGAAEGRERDERP